MINVILIDNWNSGNNNFLREIIENNKRDFKVYYIEKDRLDLEINDKFSEYEDGIYYLFMHLEGDRAYAKDINDRSIDTIETFLTQSKQYKSKYFRINLYSSKPRHYELGLPSSVPIIGIGDIFKMKYYHTLFSKIEWKNTLGTPFSIFLSHAGRDQEIVGKYKDFFEIMGIKKVSLYNSNRDWQNINTTENQRVLNEMKESVVQINFISESYLKSSVCLFELGFSFSNPNSFNIKIGKDIGDNFIFFNTKKPIDGFSKSDLEEFFQKGDFYNLLEKFEFSEKVRGTEVIARISSLLVPHHALT